MTVAVQTSQTSQATAHAVVFVADHKSLAESMGAALAEHTNDPAAFAAALRSAFGSLADPLYLEGQRRVAPGIGRLHGVRWPLITAVARGFRRVTRRDRPTPLLFIADRLLREPELEALWFAFDLLARTITAEPERSWQLLRRASREAADWITVDSLAHPVGAGVALEPFRWAELEQLVFSPSRWERRLVGSTIATMVHGRGMPGRDAALVSHAIPLLGQLMGDAEPDVQKALSWAWRSLADIDRETVTTALREETELAARTDDGHRAWVIRDSLTKLDPTAAAELRERLDGIRRRSGAPSTSSAAALAARFGALPDPRVHPEPPLA